MPTPRRFSCAGIGFPHDLWSELERELGLYYGAASSEEQAMAARITVVLDADGCLLARYDQVNALTHPDEVLADLPGLLGC